MSDTTNTPKVPASVTLPEDLPKTAVSKFSGKRYPATAEHFFPYRAIPGALHLGSRPRVEDKEYRESLKADTGRTVKARPRVKDPVEIARLAIARVAAEKVEAEKVASADRVEVARLAIAAVSEKVGEKVAA